MSTVNPLLAALLCGLTTTTLAQAPAQFQLELTGLSSLTVRTTTADVDGDGDLDLLATEPFSQSPLQLWRNDLPAGFTDVTATQLPPGLQGGFVAPLDADGDGDVDLFVSGSPGTLSSALVRNNGSGLFTVAAVLPGLAPGWVSIGDLDNDGDLDLALTAQVLLGSPHAVLVNDGAGGFSSGPSLNTGGSSLVLFDLDGDGDLDVLAAESRQLLRNDGGLTFTDVAATRLQVPASVSLGAAFGGDLDGDGDTDFVALGPVGGGQQILLDQGNNLVLVGTAPTQPPASWVELADVDRDGDLDLLRSHPTGALSLALNNGNATFVDAPSRLPPLPIFSRFLTAADFDRDGDPEVLTSFLVSTPLLLRNRHVHLDAGPAVRGQNWNVDVWSEPGYAIADGLAALGIGLARLPAPQPLPGLGDLWLAGPLQLAVDVIPQVASRRTFTFAVPALPQLVGIELNSQALVVAGNGALRLTTVGVTVIQ